MRAIRRFSLFLLLAGTLAASTVLPVNFARLSRSAHHVVAGRVTSITADKDPATGYISPRSLCLSRRRSLHPWRDGNTAFA